jgi:hypothetical protein
VDYKNDITGSRLRHRPRLRLDRTLGTQGAIDPPTEIIHQPYEHLYAMRPAFVSVNLNSFAEYAEQLMFILWYITGVCDRGMFAPKAQMT